MWEEAVRKKSDRPPLEAPRRGDSRVSRTIEQLAELSPEVWLEVPAPVVGYNYRIEVQVLGHAYPLLLDTGAMVSAVPEEIVVGLINHCRKRGLLPGDPAWPVQLERWSSGDRVVGVVKGQSIEIVGAAVLPVVFLGVDGVRRERKLRFKILRKGSSTWAGLILGGPSLDAAPFGLGFRPALEGHYLDALGVCCRRWEVADPRDQGEACFVMMAAPGGRSGGRGPLRPDEGFSTGEQGSETSTGLPASGLIGRGTTLESPPRPPAGRLEEQSSDPVGGVHRELGGVHGEQGGVEAR